MGNRNMMDEQDITNRHNELILLRVNGYTVFRECLNQFLLRILLVFFISMN